MKYLETTHSRDKKYFNQQKLRSSFFLVNIELLVKIAVERVIRSPSDGFGGGGGGGAC